MEHAPGLQASPHSKEKFAGFFPQVSSGGGINSVSAGTKISGVHISQEDVFFLELTFQPQREERLLNLSAD